ncbi:MAG: SDR family oxidoreductase [Planctomycetes bacterium]|nr:SDR family oxidoreductase [Planctomycetota bacterium]
MKLRDQVAFVTGASRGIGKALALSLAREGCDIVVASKTDRPHEKLPGTIHDTAREVEAAGRRALALRLDVREDAAIEEAVAKTMEAFGRIDILIHNAGAIFLADVLDTPVKRFDLVMGVNARAVFALSRAVLPHMIVRRYGHIVTMSPPMKAKPMPGKAAYMLSKFGMTFLAQSLAEEARPHNVAVNALWPVTAIDSQAVRTFWPGREEDWRTPEIVCDAAIAIVSRPPAERTGQALYDEDVLREAGIADFSRYALVPGSTPPPFSKTLAEE